MQAIKVLKINSRGRKYFTCTWEKYKAKLIINEVSEDFISDQTVYLVVNDLTVTDRYGTKFLFEPVRTMTQVEFTEARDLAIKRQNAEKWLKYAEYDVSTGRYHSNAIQTALAINLPEFSERVASVKDQADKNEKVHIADVEAKNASRKAEIKERAKELSSRILFPIRNTPPLGKAVEFGKKILVFTKYGKEFRISEDSPSIFGSHLLGFEGSMGCYCYYREADAQELEALNKEKKAAEFKALTTRKRAELVMRFKTEGERPEGEFILDGERLLDTSNIYGGGDWFVKTAEYIWYCQNNGGDGDDWSINNVRTGGTGAIGWRLPISEMLVSILEDLQLRP